MVRRALELVKEVTPGEGKQGAMEEIKEEEEVIKESAPIKKRRREVTQKPDARIVEF